MKFEINNDLKRPIADIHNIGHLLIAFLIALFTGFYTSYFIGLLWEIGDGLKPWHYKAPTKVKLAKFPSANWFKREFLYSNKFSLQDVLYWNLAGAMLGSLVHIYLIFIF